MPTHRQPKAGPAQAPESVHTPSAATPSGGAGFLVVGVGASAGGLEACRKLLEALPRGAGVALILVQHLDPTHESMMVDLLRNYTDMTVLQAAEGMEIEADHLYVIPPGAYLSTVGNALHLSPPSARHGARLPFDFLLNTLAMSFGPRAACVVLSGTGSDGGLGLKEVKACGGFVIAQDPAEAGYDGMPRNAMLTGLVDLVLPVAAMGDALAHRAADRSHSPAPAAPLPAAEHGGSLSEIIDLLRTRTAHDFRLYKDGTLDRRTERRMALLGLKAGDTGAYLNRLRSDPLELEALANDLLINVTSFFRDPKVFEHLAHTTIPALFQGRQADQPLRLWVVGCSTGEEAYSLAMLLTEEAERSGNVVKFQLFASDVDAGAIATARDGFYGDIIEGSVSPARLARFLHRETGGYRVSGDLRASVIFTVQDVLIDPPFSRLDMVSCRNLLIYLRPEAQVKVIALFHFALRPGGLLLLGGSETTGGGDTGFAVESKAARLYRHSGGVRPSDVQFRAEAGELTRAPLRRDAGQPADRQAALGELCQALILEDYTPAAALITAKGECVFSMGPTDRYLRVAAGHPNNDLMAMAREGVREKLRLAMRAAGLEPPAAAILPKGVGGENEPNDPVVTVREAPFEGELLFLVCFEERPKSPAPPDGAARPADSGRIAELERDLAIARGELRAAVRQLQISAEEQKTVNEEARSVNEEYQASNEELLASKEELQSMNEELTALNSQLHETLELKRTAANDLENVLYSTRVPTIFLDKKLKIRLFTPASRALFNVIETDIGRPLSDLNILASDTDLLGDAHRVLSTSEASEHEIEADTGAWYRRRIMPYRTQQNAVEGVVITFVDISESREAAASVQAARAQAEGANASKSRFLAAASHDLRQPLQTLSLVHGLLAKTVEGDRAKRLVARMEDTIGAMAGMLNALLDINQIEAGTVRAERVRFPIRNLLDRLKDEFTYHAQAQKLEFHVVPSGIWVDSDPRLLEQMLRNLIANALKYTRTGKILVGCRRRADALSIEVWDSGIGIPEGELQSIFEEFHQLGNPARERSLGLGLGLGLSIVRSLGVLLGHEVSVRSLVGRGSVFTVEIMMRDDGRAPSSLAEVLTLTAVDGRAGQARGAILVVEDDPALRELLEFALKHEGHRVLAASDGVPALEQVRNGGFAPDLILADYNLPNGMNGLQVMAEVRAATGRRIPVIMLTGDISTDALRDIARENCAQLNKPAKLAELAALIRRLLPATAVVAGGQRSTPTVTPTAGPLVYVVDDDPAIRAMIREVLEDDGRIVEDYGDCESFLANYRPGREACLLIDAYLPTMSGLDLLRQLKAEGRSLPSLMITGRSDVPMAVEAMKAGAADFLEKPVDRNDLIAGIERALDGGRDSIRLTAEREAAMAQMAALTDRQREITAMVLAGHPSKNIAADLNISQRTVENHRAAIMRKTGTRSLPALARLALAAAWTGADPD